MVVGEEGAEANADALEALGEQAPVWLLDPVDGTTNYATGKPCFAVIVAYRVRGETLAGWIHDPIADVTMWAVAGEGAWLDERTGRRAACRPRHPSRIADMAGSLSPRAADRLHGTLAEQRRRQSRASSAMAASGASTSTWARASCPSPSTPGSSRGTMLRAC